VTLLWTSHDAEAATLGKASLAFEATGDDHGV